MKLTITKGDQQFLRMNSTMQTIATMQAAVADTLSSVLTEWFSTEAHPPWFRTHEVKPPVMYSLLHLIRFRNTWTACCCNAMSARSEQKKKTTSTLSRVTPPPWNTSWMSWPKDCESRVLMSTLLAWWRTCSRSGEDENSAASCRRLEALHSHSGSLNPPFSNCTPSGTVRPFMLICSCKKLA